MAGTSIITSAQVNSPEFMQEAAQAFCAAFPDYHIQYNNGKAIVANAQRSIAPAFYLQRYWPDVAAGRPAPPLSFDDKGVAYLDWNSYAAQQATVAHNAAAAAADNYWTRVGNDLSNLPKDFAQHLIVDPLRTLTGGVGGGVTDLTGAAKQGAGDLGQGAADLLKPPLKVADDATKGLLTSVMWPVVIVAVVGVVLLIVLSKSGTMRDTAGSYATARKASG